MDAQLSSSTHVATDSRGAPPTSGKYQLIARCLAKRLARNELRLPMPPAIAMEAMRLCGEETVDFMTLDALIRNDPTLVAQLLKIANSPAHSPGRQLTSLRQAMMFLGMDNLRQLLMQAVAEAYLFQGLSAVELERERRHAVAVGRAAHTIAKACGADHAQAFTAGIMHDIGRIIAPQIVDMESFPGPERHELVEALHTKVGAHIVKCWNMPSHLAEVIAEHHCPETASLNVRVVIAAERLALYAGFTAADEEYCGATSIEHDPIWASLPLLPTSVPRLVKNVIALLQGDA